MSSDPSRSGQYPPPPSPWDSHPPYPQRLDYAEPSDLRSHPSSIPRTDMVTLQPQHQQDLYPLPPPRSMYQGHPQDPYRGGPPQHINFNQPAPRQRTAIACRYCRRRKIRCSGFEASEDGRCTNCQRFQQECIFTPVSSQAQAFVPAHTAYPHLRNTGGLPPQRGGRSIYPQQGPPVIYGAHGQPLGAMPPHQDPNYPPGYPIPNPALTYQSPSPMYDDRGGPTPHPHDQVSRKRAHLSSAEPFALNCSSIQPASSSQPDHSQQRIPASAGGRRGSGSGYEYPDPTNLAPVSPASSSTSYHASVYPQPPIPQQQQQQPYYPAPVVQQTRRSSPQSTYSYEQRASSSPHGSNSPSSGYHLGGGLHPPQVLPPTRDNGRTPPPGQVQSQQGAREGGTRGSGGMRVSDMLSPGDGQGGRTSTDSDMLNALNRRAR